MNYIHYYAPFSQQFQATRTCNEGGLRPLVPRRTTEIIIKVWYVSNPPDVYKTRQTFDIVDAAQFYLQYFYLNLVLAQFSVSITPDGLIATDSSLQEHSLR
jgi:hypothetical protein